MGEKKTIGLILRITAPTSSLLGQRLCGYIIRKLVCFVKCVSKCCVCLKEILQNRKSMGKFVHLNIIRSQISMYSIVYHWLQQECVHVAPVSLVSGSKLSKLMLTVFQICNSRLASL